MNRLFGLFGCLVILGLVGLGFVSYPVTEPIQRATQRLVGGSGWNLSVRQARWVPWSGLDMSDLRLQSSRGGRIHLVHLRIIPRLASLLKGYLATQWTLGEIRIDPGSWGIYKLQAQELLSAGPVTTSGTARLTVHRNRLELEQLSLGGPLLFLRGRGSWLEEGKGPRIHLAFRGRLARRILQSMDLDRGSGPEVPWEPFRGSLEGAMGGILLSFDSRFIQIHPRVEGS